MNTYEITYRPDEVRNNVTKYPPSIVEAESPSEAIVQVLVDPRHESAWEFAERPGGFVLADPEDSYGYYLAVEVE